MRFSLYALALLAISVISGACLLETSATPAAMSQTIEKTTASDSLDDELQKWQGRVIQVRGNDLVLRIEGEKETFDVSPEADIRKNRRKCDLDTLAPRDFVTVVTAGSELGERVVKIRAFSKR